MGSYRIPLSRNASDDLAEWKTWFDARFVLSPPGAATPGELPLTGNGKWATGLLCNVCQYIINILLHPNYV